MSGCRVCIGVCLGAEQDLDLACVDRNHAPIMGTKLFIIVHHKDDSVSPFNTGRGFTPATTRSGFSTAAILFPKVSPPKIVSDAPRLEASTWAPLAEDVTFPLPPESSAPWEFYLGCLGIGKSQSSAEAKLALIRGKADLQGYRPRYRHWPDTKAGKKLPPVEMAYSVRFAGSAEKATFAILHAKHVSSLRVEGQFNPELIGHQVRCTLKGVTRMFVHQGNQRMRPLVRNTPLDEKIGAFALIKLRVSDSAPLAGLSYTLDGISFRTFMVSEGTTAFWVTLEFFQAILSEKKVWGTTFYCHELAAEEFVYIASVLIPKHIGDRGGYTVSLQVNKDRGVTSFKIVDTRHPTRWVAFKQTYTIWSEPLGTIVASTIGNASTSARSQYPAGSLEAQVVAETAKQYAVTKWLNLHLHAHFGLQITRHNSLPGIAIRLYRRTYMPVGTHFPTGLVPLFKMFKEVAYKGGLVHAPHPRRLFKVVYAYDMTSMYPSQIKSFPMPGGNPVWVDQVPPLNNSLCFGWVEAIARAPKGILPCLLPLQRQGSKIDDGPNINICVSHLQPCAGLFFTEELKAALAAGYEVQVFGGYLFERVEGAFTSFVDDLAQKRHRHKVQGEVALATMTKQLLNGLYGRFGLAADYPTAELLNYGDKKIAKADDGDVKPLALDVTGTPEGALVYNKQGPSGHDCIVPSSSLPVAIATTCYARIAIAPFKNLPGNPLIYSDTDSVILEHPLTPDLAAKWVSTKGEVGKLKFEGQWTDFVVAQPKKYGYIDAHGNPVCKAAGLDNDSDYTYDSLVTQTTGSGEWLPPVLPPRAKRDWSAGEIKYVRQASPTVKAHTPSNPDWTSEAGTDHILVESFFKPVSPVLREYITGKRKLPRRLQFRG